MRISLEICLQMADCVLPNAGILTFLELTKVIRDVCIIYMLRVRVLEQKRHVALTSTPKKKKIEGGAR